MTYIGIDTGKNTGLARWDSTEGKFLFVETLPIHKALFYIHNLHQQGLDMKVIVEDARQRKWYTGNVTAKAQGAGSIKRDATIWEDFLKDEGIPYQMVAPSKGMTKPTQEYFQFLTKWQHRTSNHARDAAMLVYGK